MFWKNLKQVGFLIGKSLLKIVFFSGNIIVLKTWKSLGTPGIDQQFEQI